ncbi:hypothetical protein QUF07_09735 [Lentilactobacillus sp. TOM.63]|uniref:hypothetical protein n=1 Tax=Lentilactobacillus TaxID=2767893 RepID=UPI001C25F57E|nr:MULTISPECIES: hypothetical protein [Lentilactobacillus]MBU9789952.1 hypothetical protein [Lentilactobacillus dabitei]MDM7516984.1 hypothetical protein [Lentilactobacillus sp. TOM.63]
MKKQRFILILSAVLAVGLAGCSSQNHKNQSNQKAALSANMQNSSSTASSTKKAHATKSLSDYQYKVPKKVADSKNYVKDGNLTSPSQFSYDRFGTEQTLTKIATNAAVLSAGNVSYKVNKVRVLKNTAKTSEAKTAAEQVLNISSIPDTYFTFVLNYTVTNKHNTTIALNGVQSVKTDAGQTMTTADQLSDSSAGNKIPANESATFVMNGYLYDYQSKPAKKLFINFGSLFDTHGKKISDSPNRKLIVKLD